MACGCSRVGTPSSKSCRTGTLKPAELRYLDTHRPELPSVGKFRSTAANAGNIDSNQRPEKNGTPSNGEAVGARQPFYRRRGVGGRPLTTRSPMFGIIMRTGLAQATRAPFIVGDRSLMLSRSNVSGRV